MPKPTTTGDAYMNATVPKGVVDQDKKNLKSGSANEGPQRYALGVATVVRVDYETHDMDIRVETGETFQYKVPITQAGAGPRRFFGSMPMVGDACIVGWAAEEGGTTRKPYPLTWIPIGTVFGHDWVPGQPYSEDEFSLNPKNKVLVEGVGDRVRYKIRHIEPGNVLASSAQGSDLVLDEGVLLANRRGNEIRLRDADQAIILRSLQQFHAGSGFRIYGGMVQREATLLPTQMFSDGIHWDAPQQVDTEGTPLIEFGLGTAPVPTGDMTPASVFQVDEEGNPTATTFDGDPLVFSGNIDPYVFLEQGLFISPDGTPTSPIESTATYAGKPLYRVATTGENGVTDPQADTFTEYRIEVAHVADGTLPVTEQTDQFDADRTPDAVPRENSTLNQSINAAFIEFVIGTVVGNDPFSLNGRRVYGLPLTPTVFDGEARSPSLSSAVGVPIEQQAASLFRLRPPTDVNSSPTWWSTTKDGRLFFSIPGPGTDWSVQGSMGAGARIGIGATQEGESLRFETDGTFSLQAQRGDNAQNIGVDIGSKGGAVRIYGGGSTTIGSIDARSTPIGEGDDRLPAVIIESATNLELRASRAIRLKADILDFANISEFNMKGARATINIESGENISLTSKVFDKTVMGKATETYSGPKDSLPTNLPLREVKFVGSPATGVPGGTVDKYSILFGDREETLTAGNHRTTVLVGNATYAVLAGTYTASGGGSSMRLSVGGAQITAPTGGVSLSAAAGAVAIQAGTGIGLTAPTIALTAPAISAPGAHLPAGGVLTDGCINPLTGTSFLLSGVPGVQTFRIGV